MCLRWEAVCLVFLGILKQYCKPPPPSSPQGEELHYCSPKMKVKIKKETEQIPTIWNPIITVINRTEYMAGTQLTPGKDTTELRIKKLETHD